jgi:hypothetical protein
VVCAITGDLVTVLNAGKCSVSAGLPDNSATPVTQTFTIRPATPSGTLATVSGLLINATDPQSVAVGDFNGDGIADIAVADYSGVIEVALGDGAGGFHAAPGSPYPAGIATEFAGVGDFNGDGIQDIAAINRGPGNITVLLGTSSGGFIAAPGSPFVTGATSGPVVVADFNGDGFPDIAAVNDYKGDVAILFGKGSGGFGAVSYASLPVISKPESLAAGDFNGDGIADLAITDYTNNDVVVLLGNGSGGFSAAPGSPFATGTQPTCVAVGDFNADGNQDLALPILPLTM